VRSQFVLKQFNLCAIRLTSGSVREQMCSVFINDFVQQLTLKPLGLLLLKNNKSADSFTIMHWQCVRGKLTIACNCHNGMKSTTCTFNAIIPL